MAQAEQIPFTWNSVVGGIIGCGIGVVALIGMHRLRERRRDARRERAPQTEKILRPAGYSALKNIEDLWERTEFAVLQVIGASLVSGVVWGLLYPLLAGLLFGRLTLSQLFHIPKGYVLWCIALFGFGALLWALKSFLIAANLYEQIRNWRFGMRGEQAVAEKLADGGLAAAGYRVFHDIPAEKGKKKWNVDHVVVGPGGVFVLETKARPMRTAKWDQEENEVRFDGKVLTFPWCYDDRAALQVEYNARWVRKFLGVYAPKDVLIHPVIVVPGWFVREMCDGRSVRVMNAVYLVEYLKGAKRIYSKKDLETAVQRLDDACRSLEF